MRKYPGIPELLEQYMQELGTDNQWVTVQELRGRFGLTRYQCNTVSGFLRRLHAGTFGPFPYIVLRIEQAGSAHPWDAPRCRYLVKRKEQAALPGTMHNTGVQIPLEAESGESGQGTGSPPFLRPAFSTGSRIPDHYSKNARGILLKLLLPVGKQSLIQKGIKRQISEPEMPFKQAK